MTDSERDLLDAVLAGRTDGIPDAFRPVADTLAALRAAPASAELSGEAAARAEFRAFMRGGGARADPALTLVLPVPPAEALPRRAPRHRRRRRPLARPRMPLRPVVLGTAAAAVIAIVIGLTSAAPGSLQNLARFGHPMAGKSPTAAGSGQRAAVGSLQGKATAEPAPSPAVSQPVAPRQPSMSTLCQQYLDFYTRPESGPDWEAEAALGKEIANIAELKVTKLPWDGFRVYGYCAEYLYGKSYKEPRHQKGMPGAAFGWPGSGGTTGTSGQEGSGPSSGGGSGR